MLGLKSRFLESDRGQLLFDITYRFVLSRLYLLDLSLLDLCYRLNLISPSIKLPNDCLSPSLQLANQLPQLYPLSFKQIFLLLAVLHTV